MQITLTLNEKGRRIGDSHWNAKLTNHEVDLLLKMHDEGMTYGALAAIFDISKRSVRDICSGRRRCQTVMGFKVVEV